MRQAEQRVMQKGGTEFFSKVGAKANVQLSRTFCSPLQTSLSLSATCFERTRGDG